MKVNGEAFRKAREEIRKQAGSPIGTEKIPGVGTQEWLAGIAQVKGKNGNLRNIGVRTIQMLEKGEASLQTVDAVSSYLGVVGRELIIGYGENSITATATNVIDFRSVESPYKNKSTFYKKKFLMTIDPMLINFSSEDIDLVKIEHIRSKLFISDYIIDLPWKYEVSLTPNGNGWLGYSDSVHEVVINNHSTWRKSIMFNQNNGKDLSWIDLIRFIEGTNESLLKIETTVFFTNFQKRIAIGLSVFEIKKYIEHAIERGGMELLTYIQPKALVFE